MELAPGTLLGRYQIISAIGSGGMGDVYRARDVRLGRDVAIKILPDHSVDDENARTRFDREARAVAALNHPNICALYDVGHDAGHDFLVMELIDGESLDARIRRGPVQLSDLLDVGIALADALEAAHARGLIHRDLKPGNIVLTSRGQPKILDFGLVKMIEPPDPADHTRATELSISSVGTIVGTVAYMSPEQLRGDALDHRTDLFSLGLVLYEMATGRRAFTGTVTATMAAILTERPAGPRVLRPDLPPKLDEAILKTLEKERENRCQTAAELRADLRRIKRDADTDAPQLIAAAQSESQAAKLTPFASSSDANGRLSDTQVLVALVQRNRWIVAAAILLLVIAAGMVVRSVRTTGTPHVRTSDTLDVQAITVAGDASLGVVSPDGKFVAYVRSQGADRSIWVRQIATQSDVRIVAPEPGRDFVGLTVTPDGNYVDFVAWTAGAASPDLWRIPFLGGAVRKVRADVWTAPGWSPDGLHMCFVRVTSDGSTSSLIVADPDGLNERVMATRRLPLLFDSAYLLSRPVNRPSWSPDGTQIALVGGSADPAQENAPTHVVIVGATDGNQHQVIAVPHAVVLEVNWRSPTELIVTRGPDSRRLQIWRIELPTAIFSQATHDLAGFRDLTTTVDGSIIVSTRQNRRAGLWIGTSGDDIRPALPDTTTLPDDVAVRNDGALVFSQRSGDTTDIVRLDPDHSNATLVAKGGSEPVLTHDGRTIVFTGLDGLYRVGVDGSQQTALVEGNAFMPALTKDNQTVLFVSTRSGVQSLWSVPAAGGTPIERSHQFAWSPRVSPDGLRLFVGKDPQTAIICSLPACGGGREVTLQNALPATVHWTPDSNGIAFVKADDPTNIWVQDIESRRVTQLTHFADRQINNFAWSADGHRLAISRTTLESDVVMIRGLR